MKVLVVLVASLLAVIIKSAGSVDLCKDCGKLKDETCTNSEECISGFVCIAPNGKTHLDKTANRVCTSRCEHMMCPLYHDCVLKGAMASCECRAHPCSQKKIGNCSATDPITSETIKFNNECLMETESCLRTVSGKTSLTSKSCG